MNDDPACPQLRLKLGQKIGSGAHRIRDIIATLSTVRLARNLLTMEKVAVKVISLKGAGRQIFDDEKRILERLPLHRCVPLIEGTLVTGKTGYIVLEYLPFPTLAIFLRSNGAFEPRQAAAVLLQLVDAINFLASVGYAHRDLKTENMMINPDTFNLKLIDFSLATQLSSYDDEDDSYRGTPFYMAPEVLRNDYQLYKVIPTDLWSAATIYWECLLGKHPLHRLKSRRETLQAQRTLVTTLAMPTFPGLKCDEAVQILSGMLPFHPEDRFSLDETRSAIVMFYPDRLSPKTLRGVLPPKISYTSDNTVSHVNVFQGKERQATRANRASSFQVCNSTASLQLVRNTKQ